MTNDQMDQIGFIIDFISNVDKYKQLIVDLKAAKLANDASLDALIKGGNVATAQTALDSAKEKFAIDVAATQDSLAKTKDVQNRQVADKVAQLAQKEQDMLNQERLFVSREAAIKASEATIAKEKEDLGIQQAQYAALNENLKQRELALAVKAQKVQDLITQ